MTGMPSIVLRRVEIDFGGSTLPVGLGPLPDDTDMQVHREASSDGLSGRPVTHHRRQINKAASSSVVGELIPGSLSARNATCLD